MNFIEWHSRALPCPSWAAQCAHIITVCQQRECMQGHARRRGNPPYQCVYVLAASTQVRVRAGLCVNLLRLLAVIHTGRHKLLPSVSCSEFGTSNACLLP